MNAQELLPGVIVEEEYDPFLEATLQFEEAARELDLEDWIVQRLRHTEREITVNLPLVRDDGRAVSFTGFRVQHNTVRGAAIGGVRLAPEAHLSQGKALAMATTWQCALLDIPFGGSAGAIVCDPQRLSERELSRLVKDYIQALRGLIGPFTDVIMQDVGSNERILAWMLDAHAHAEGHLHPGVVTNKPEALFGLPGHEQATADGLLLLLEEILEERKGKLAGQRVAIQGFGKLGRSLARLLHQAGARVVAVADISGGLYREDGLDVSALEAHVERTGVLFGYPEAETVCNADVLEARCDVLVPAAVERQLTAVNAEHIQARYVLEGAHGATTRAANKILEARGVTVVPDLLANAGGTAQAYLEWTLNVCYRYLLVGEAEEHLKRRILHAYQTVRATARHHHTNLRHAAHLRAVEQVAAALRLR